MTFQPPNHVTSIGYTKFEHFRIFRFRVYTADKQKNRQTDGLDSKIIPTPIDIGNNDNADERNEKLRPEVDAMPTRRSAETAFIHSIVDAQVCHTNSYRYQLRPLTQRVIVSRAIEDAASVAQFTSDVSVHCAP